MELRSRPNARPDFLNGLTKSNPAPAALAEHLLLLLAGQGVTDGTLAETVRARLRECMGNAGFASSLAAFEETRAERFFRLLAAAGMEGPLKRKVAG